MFSTTEREIKDWVSEVAEALDVVIPDDRLVTIVFYSAGGGLLAPPPPPLKLCIRPSCHITRTQFNINFSRQTLDRNIICRDQLL